MRANRNATQVPVTVSVIIPTYNCWPLLKGAVCSALGQTVRPHEVIVVDDESTDETPAAVTQQFGSQIVYHRQSNGGPSRARNAGARLSTGTWLAFLDADDEWRADKLAKQLACVTDEN